jgi:hypothetical protein
MGVWEECGFCEEGVIEPETVEAPDWNIRPPDIKTETKRAVGAVTARERASDETTKG